jgi:hypothetical protein
MIEASQRMITINSQGGGELGGMNPVIRRHLELEIKTLQNAPRDPEKLERLLRLKERQKEEEAMHTRRTHKGSLLKSKCSSCILYLVCRNRRSL